MKAKNKVTAILAILMLTISIFAAFPFPVQAQLPPNPTVVLFDQFTAPSYPMNVTVKHPENKTMIGKTFVAWVYLIPNSTTMKVSRIEAGFNVTNPYVLDVFTVLHNSPSPGVLPPTIGDLFGDNVIWTPGHYNLITGEYSPAVWAVNTTKVNSVTVPVTGAALFYIIFRVKWWGESWIKPTEVELLDENGLEISPTIPISGYFKMRRVFVELAATIWRDPPPPAPSKIGDTTIMPMSISNTEPINSWTVNIIYNTTFLSCVAVKEGPYLNVTAPGQTTWTADWSTPGVISASCSLPSGMSRTGDGVLMYIVFMALSYTGTCPVTDRYIIITSFQPLDSNGNPIDPSTSDPDYPNPKPGYFEFNKLVYVVPVNPVGSPITIWQYPAHTIGETFNYYLYIKGCSQKVHSWKAGFRYNPKVLDCISFTEGTYLSSVGTTTCTGGTIHHDTGVVESLNCTLDDPGAYATDDGLLAIITFEVKDYGRTVIDLTDTDDDPCEAKLVDIYGDEVVSAWPRGLYVVDGVFEFRAPVTVEMSIGSLYKYVDVSQVFTVTLTIDSLEKVYSWMSGLGFKPEMLNCTGVVYGTYITGGMDIPPEIDNELGYVSVGQTFLGAGSATGAGTLATITFEVIDDELPIGPSILGFTVEWGKQWQTAVIDTNGDPCALATLKDGEVRIIADVSGDGDVRSDDVFAVLAAVTKKVKGIMTVPELLAENPFYDLNEDGDIRSDDVFAVLAQVTKKVKGIWP